MGSGCFGLIIAMEIRFNFITQPIKNKRMKQKNVIWIGLAGLFAATATFFFVKKRNQSNDERPPKGAPQLHIENPGSQDDFPKAPSESELG
jgi:LPXTG-motif cell wall-anchored protein